MPGKRILIVEDKEENFDIIRFGLKRLRPEGDFVLFWAATLKEGGALYRKNRDDLSAVVMDACVPGHNPNTMGLIEEIRADGFRGLIIAASCQPEYNKRLIEAGADVQADKVKVASMLFELIFAALPS